VTDIMNRIQDRAVYRETCQPRTRLDNPTARVTTHLPNQEGWKVEFKQFLG